MGKQEVWQGTLALMVLKTLEVMGPQHGYGIARRIEQTSGDLLSLNYGTLYPALVRLEDDGYIAAEWGVSENNRKAKFYRLTRAGRRRVARATEEWVTSLGPPDSSRDETAARTRLRVAVIRGSGWVSPVGDMRHSVSDNVLIQYVSDRDAMSQKGT